MKIQLVSTGDNNVGKSSTSGSEQSNKPRNAGGRGGGRGTRGRLGAAGGAGRGGAREKKTAVTAEELDADLDTYISKV